MNNTNPDTKKNMMQLVYCVACTLLLLFAAIVPSTMLFTMVAFGIFSVCHSVLFAHKNFLLCIIPPAVSVAASTFLAFSDGIFDSADFLSVALVVFALIASVSLYVCSAKKASGSVTFATLTVVMTLFTAVLLLTVIYEVYGTVNGELIKKSISDFASVFADIMRESYEMSASLASPELAKQYESAVMQYASSIEMTLNVAWPSIITTSGMIMAAFMFLLYKPAVKLADAKDVCLDGRTWRFGLSKVSAVFFEIVFAAYVILSFFSDNVVLKVACMNLVSVLMLPFAYIGFRYITGFFAKRFGSKVGAVVIMIVAVSVLFIILQGSIMILASLFGTSAIYRERKTENTD